jgi:phosphoglucosamine mutase
MRSELPRRCGTGIGNSESFMSRQYFGTDGVRGKVGEEPMTVEFALRLASAAARVLAPDGGTVLVGKDTRLSGYMFEAALEAGFVAAGVNVLLVGPLPTPGIAYMLQKLHCDFGAVISASHNPYDDNGIKFFDRNGAKLPDELEHQIESYLAEPALTRESQRLGKATRVDKQRTLYQEFCASTMPAGVDLSGLKIVIDCANGAAYKVAPRVLADLGADIIPIGCSPNGRNINDGCGSTEPELLRMTVAGVKAQAGIALDGDGDRLVMVDHLGRMVDGDQLLYVLARARQREGGLAGPVVGTAMSNLGLELALGAQGIDFLRAAVGDRYVLQMLRENGGVLGGETSGHLLCLDKTTTGDGLVAALQVLAVMKQTRKSLAELAAGMQKFPQVMINVRVAEKFDAASHPVVSEAIARLEQSMAGRGRVVLRASGTEPVIRVMVEGEDEATVRAQAASLADVVRRAAA